MSKIKTPVALLLRVSGKDQCPDRQQSELLEVCKKNGWEAVHISTKHLTGSANEEDRDDLELVRELVEKGEIKKILIHEVSRLSRKNSVSHKFLEDMTEAGVSIYWYSQCVETLLPSGKRSPMAGMLFSIMSEMAVTEKEVLVDRIKSGLEEAKRKGVTLGRPVGSTMSDSDKLKKHADVVRQLKKGKSNRDVAKITGKGVSTVKRVRAIIGI